MERVDLSTLLLPKESRPQKDGEATTGGKPISSPANGGLRSHVVIPGASQGGRREASSESKPDDSIRVALAALNPTTPSGEGSLNSKRVARLVSLCSRILQDLERNLSCLLTLNPSRREAVARHLDLLAGIVGSPAASQGLTDPAAGLRRWIEGPRSPQQHRALRGYLEEVALLTLGQAMVLKVWSDRKLRSWNPVDLGRLNWALSSALKPHVPMNRESWLVTKPNLYSWYKPNAEIQKEMDHFLQSWNFGMEGKDFLGKVLRAARMNSAVSQEAQGYDRRFYEAFWQHVGEFGFQVSHDMGHWKRKSVVFTPTLRDGRLSQAAPDGLSWMALEEKLFLLLVAELDLLWQGPAAPPVWMNGTGFEVFSRDQLSFGLSAQKRSRLARLREMEAVDLAVVFEERSVRSPGRTAEAVRFREQIELFPALKKLKANGTSQGDIQAMVALSKLRPGGVLFWAREEPLGEVDGVEVLAFLLDRAKLVCEWDMSALKQEVSSSTPLCPKYLYCFVRELDVQDRMNHRPARIAVEGAVQNEIQVPIVLADLFQSALSMPISRDHWKIRLHSSPTPQKEWANHWPDPTENRSLQRLDHLRTTSAPLGSMATVRQVKDLGGKEQDWWSAHRAGHGFVVWTKGSGEERRVKTAGFHSLERNHKDRGHGFVVVVTDARTEATLRHYMESAVVREWLEYYGERRGDRWDLKLQNLKWIPIHSAIVKALQAKQISTSGQEWLSSLSQDFKAARQKLAALPLDFEGALKRAELYTALAEWEARFSAQNRSLFKLVDEAGEVVWRELLAILPPSECVGVALHPDIRLSGNLAPHIPIEKMDRTQTPKRGIFLGTTSGMNLHIEVEDPALQDVLWEQLQGLSYPTWSEVTRCCRLPRQMDFARATAEDLLRSVGEQRSKLAQVKGLLDECSQQITQCAEGA